MGWTKAQLNSLPEDEQLDLFAYDHYRQQRITDIMDGLQTERPKPTPEQLKSKTTISSWEPGAAATLLLGLID